MSSTSRPVSAKKPAAAGAAAAKPAAKPAAAGAAKPIAGASKPVSKSPTRPGSAAAAKPATSTRPTSAAKPAGTTSAAKPAGTSSTRPGSAAKPAAASSTRPGTASKALSPTRPTTARRAADTAAGVFFFDIDNCLYSKSTGVSALMDEKIKAYFGGMGFSPEMAAELQHKYNQQYGLTIRGLVKEHNVDPVDYDKKVDGSLPLDKVLKKDPELRAMLKSLKMKKWACTNASSTHANRCLQILGIADLFEGITFCDYTQKDFICKPEKEYFLKAMKDANISDMSKCFFVDDAAINVDAAQKLGWTSVHVADSLPSSHGAHQILRVHELPSVLPQLFEKQ